MKAGQDSHRVSGVSLPSGRAGSSGIGAECADRSAAGLWRQPPQIVIIGEVVLHHAGLKIDPTNEDLKKILDDLNGAHVAEAVNDKDPEKALGAAKKAYDDRPSWGLASQIGL